MRGEIFKKRERVVVQFVVRRINKCGVTVLDDIEQLVHGLVAFLDLGPIACPKLSPTFRIMAKPFAQVGARRDVFQP